MNRPGDIPTEKLRGLTANANRLEPAIWSDGYGGEDAVMTPQSDGRFVTYKQYKKIARQLAAANAALDKLRKIVPEDENANEWCDNCDKFVNAEYRMDEGEFCPDCNGFIYATPADALRAILYAKEAEHDNQR